jgi:nitrite reductase/ring-hydroxylating ferredoxin subunit
MPSVKKKFLVCKLDDLKESSCHGWDGVIDESPIQCFLIYHQNKVYSYLNRCPHTGVNLDWVPHQFLDSNDEFIQCATHGALFRIENGHCLHGPCIGEHLQVIENEIIEDKIYLIL